MAVTVVAAVIVTVQVMPAVLGVDGCVGLSMLVDRISGCCIITTAWRKTSSM